MSQIAQEPQCLTPIPAVVWQQLRGVLDPELDESILELGFVEALRFEDGHLTVELWLPTTWCSPNFAYMMAEDVRLVLLTVESVRQVSVLLKDHFAAERIEAAVNAGKPFKDAFPDEALGDLDELRLYFLQKGFLKRQERLLRSLLHAGWSFMEIAALHVGDLEIQGEVCRIRREDGHLSAAGSAEVAGRYLQRRAQLGLDCSQAAALVTDVSDNSIPAERLREHFIAARTVRVAQDANSSICCALLDARKRTSSQCLQMQTER